MSYSQAQLFEARAVRDGAMKMAVDHADRVYPSWSQEAKSWVEKYTSTHKDPFVCDELREWAEPLGCPVPVTGQAWGSVMAMACKSGLITKNGYRTCIFPTRKTTHTKPVTEWVAA